MRKKDLLAMTALQATEEMISLARRDRGRQRPGRPWEPSGKKKMFRVLYSRAVVENGILKTAFFCREDLLRGELLPRYEVYISPDEYKDITYLPQEKKWSESRIGNLGVESYARNSYRVFTEWAMEEWEEPGAREAVGGLLACYSDCAGKASVFSMVDTWQQANRVNRLRGRHQREKEQIDMAMAEVPGLPKDWDTWVYRSAYCRDHYMLYHYGDKENSAWCTFCGKDVKLKKKVKHGAPVRCPACRRKVTALAWNRQKTIVDTIRPGILQERKHGGYVLRIFDSKICRRKETDWKLSERDSYNFEKYRIFMDPEFRQERIYEYTFWKNRYENEMRWCYATDHGGYGYYEVPAGECVLYSRNIKRLRKDTCLKYMPVETLLRGNEGCYTRPVEMFYRMKQVPRIEYMIRAGLYNLAMDMANMYMDPDLVNLDRKKPWDALGIDRQQLGMAIKMNITSRQLGILQLGNGLGLRLTAEQVRFFNRELGREATRKVLMNGHAEKAMRYLRKMKEDKGHLMDYIDYLEDIRILGIIPTEDVLFPKNFQSAHERYSEMRREREEEVRAAGIRKKNGMLASMLPDLRKIYSGTKADDYLMVLPTCKEDFNREGRENHNCVGGSYFDRMLEGRCVVLFLRKKEEPDRAFCTVEMDGSRVVQCRAVRNSEPSDEVKEFMKKYSAEVAKRIAERNAAKTQQDTEKRCQNAAEALLPAI